METSTLSLIISALLPVLITLGLGIVAGKTGHFTHVLAGGLNRLVISYTLPLSLFAGMMLTPRAMLLGMGPQSIALSFALALSFFLPLLVMRYLLRLPLAQSTLLAMVIGMPAVLFIGTPVLGPLVGSVSSLLMVVSGLVQNLLILPVSLMLMSVACPSGAGAGARAWHQQIARVACQPIVWAPLFAILLVISGIQVPKSVIDSCQLLGRATGGLALFSTGVVLHAQRMALRPVTMWPVIAHNILVPLACYSLLSAFRCTPDSIQQTVLVMAIPSGSITLIVAMQFGVLEREIASAVALSTVLSIVTMGGFIALSFLPDML